MLVVLERVRMPTNYAPADAVAEPVRVLAFDDRVPVEVRIAWPDGGEEWAHGVVSAWCATAVYATVTPESDRLTRVGWFVPTDVRRV